MKDGQKTGFFLDQKLNRKAIQPLCKGARVLDCFTEYRIFCIKCRNCGGERSTWSRCMALGVHQAEENARLNGLEDR